MGYYAVDYPAFDADVRLVTNTYRHQYFDGLKEGVKDVLAFFDSRARCKDEHYVLAGYSQGAMVMYRAMWLKVNTSDELSPMSIFRRIDGILLIANGDRIAADRGVINYGTAGRKNTSWGVSWGLGFRNQAAGLLAPPAKEVPDFIRDRVHSICMESDLICDFVPSYERPGLGIDIHSNAYRSDGKGKHSGDGVVFVRSAATNIMKVTNLWWPLPVSPTPSPTPTPTATSTPTPTPTSTPPPPTFTPTLPPPEPEQPVFTMPNSLPSGTVGQPYYYQFGVVDGRPGTWESLGDLFPPGLTLSPDGVVSGTPTQAGVYWPSFAFNTPHWMVGSNRQLTIWGP